MNFLGLGPGELMLIAFLGLLVFGPSKLPEIASQVGRAVRDFRRSTADITAEFRQSFALDELVPPEPAVGPAQVYASASAATEIAPPALQAPPAAAHESSATLAPLPPPTAYPVAATSTWTSNRIGSDQPAAPSNDPDCGPDPAQFWDWEHPHQPFSSEITTGEFWAWPAPSPAPDPPTTSPRLVASPHAPGPLTAPGQPTHTLPANLH